MEELLGSPITHEHTHERDTNEKKVSKKKKKKKKDLALQLLKDYKSERDGDGDMTLITKFKEFMRKKAMSSKKFDKTEERG